MCIKHFSRPLEQDLFFEIHYKTKKDFELKKKIWVEKCNQTVLCWIINVVSIAVYIVIVYCGQ